MSHLINEKIIDNVRDQISELVVRHLYTKGTYGIFHEGYCLADIETGVVVSLYNSDGINLGTIFDTQSDLEDALAEISNDQITYTLNRFEGRVEHLLSTVDVIQRGVINEPII
ncbi:hypothetical protein CL653_02055 [bacterium]|nr:hypothetical protein [bacterium]